MEEEFEKSFQDSQPICVFLAIKGTKGDRLLFKYPFEDYGQLLENGKKYIEEIFAQRIAKINKIIEDDPWISPFNTSNESLIINGRLVGLTDDILGYLFAVRSGVCNQPFEVKINDVRFACFPMLLQQPASGAFGNNSQELPTLLLFNIVFALRATTSRSFVHGYQELSKRLALALRYEEARCNYLSLQTRIMHECQEEALNMPEASQESSYKLMLPKSELAQDLKKTFLDVTTSGYVNVYINHWIEVSYCLPQRVHWLPGQKIFEPEKLYRTLSLIRPYHGMLLLEDHKTLLQSLPVDASPSVLRLLNVLSPLKNFQTLALDCVTPLSQVMKIAEHLIYWGKAIVIFPLCETNVYVISPWAHLHSKRLATLFSILFPKQNFWTVLSEFSTPKSLDEFTNPLIRDAQQQAQQVKIVVWFLQQRLIWQLHTYVHFMCDAIELSQQDIADLSQADDDDEQVTAVTGEITTIRETADRPVDDLKAKLVQYLPADAKPDELNLFFHLLKYFNGQHPLEDIMYWENLRRSDVTLLLTRFQSVLVTCQHEDSLSAILAESFSRELSNNTLMLNEK